MHLGEIVAVSDSSTVADGQTGVVFLVAESGHGVVHPRTAQQRSETLDQPWCAVMVTRQPEVFFVLLPQKNCEHRADGTPPPNRLVVHSDYSLTLEPDLEHPLYKMALATAQAVNELDASDLPPAFVKQFKRDN